MSERSVEIRLVRVPGQPDGEDDVVEVQHRREIRSHATSIAVGQDVVRINANLLQHSGQEGGFVLAVSVAVEQNAAGRVGLVSPNADFDRDIAHLTLNKGGKGT